MTYIKLFLLIFLTLLIGELGNYVLQIDKVWETKLLENYSTVQIENILNIQHRLKWFSYVFISLFLLIKSIVITSILYIGIFFYSKINVDFKQIWNIVLISEYIFLFVGITKILWFYFFQNPFSFEELQSFYPLSAINIVGSKDIEPWFIYPLQAFNLFEVSYWLLLAYLIGKITSPTKNFTDNKYPTDFGLKIVASSYGISFLLWIVVVMFFTLNYS